jgi:hypothetical protein
MTMDEIIERALRQAGIFPPSVLGSHYCDKTEVSRVEIIVRSLEEMGLLPHCERDPRFGEKIRRIPIAIALLQFRLPDGEITTCGAFKGLGVGCCDRCHSHPLRRMRLVELQAATGLGCAAPWMRQVPPNSTWRSTSGGRTRPEGVCARASIGMADAGRTRGSELSDAQGPGTGIRPADY